MDNDLHFGSFIAVLLILVLPCIWLAAFFLFRYRQHCLEVFAASPSLRQNILLPRSKFYFLLQVLFLSAAWLFAVLALMEPQGNGHYIHSDYQKEKESSMVKETSNVVPYTREIVFLLDASASMSVNDTRSLQKRLEYAKEIIDTTLHRLSGELVSLYAFTSEVTPLVPPTLDYFFTSLRLKHIVINEGDIAGTDFEKTAQFIKEHFIDHHENSLHRTIILLSDGGDTILESLFGKQQLLREETITKPLQQAANNNVTLITVGVGSREGAVIPNVLDNGKPVRSSVEEEFLTKIASETGGHYYFADDFTSLMLADTLLEQSNEVLTAQPSVLIHTQADKIRETADNFIYDSYYQIPLMLSILCLTISLLIPDVSRSA